ncbi:Small ubiquitin modifier [Ciborinia camelliae]|nr:Small ubiquitin modifier [Ciborinia camelliae]
MMDSPSCDPQTPTPASKENRPELGIGTGASIDKPKAIALKVADQAGTEITFKIKRTKPLGKIIEAYCANKGLDPKIVRFYFDGRRIQGHYTADELEMQDDDRIDVYLEQQGGGD